MSVLAMAGIAVSAVVIGLFGLPIVADQWSGDHDEGKNLAEATGATLRKADDLDTSFGSLIPARAEAAGGEEANSDGRAQDDTASLETSSHSHEVAAALEALAAVDTGSSASGTDERIVAIEQLRDLWSPRYQHAKESHRRLDYRIEHAERAARLYFKAQGELTKQIKNSRDRQLAQISDQKEREIFLDWRAQAHQTIAQADRIIIELADMDVMITKRLLSAHFSTAYGGYLELPAAISELHRDLEQFRERSEEIAAVFVVQN